MTLRKFLTFLVLLTSVLSLYAQNTFDMDGNVDGNEWSRSNRNRTSDSIQSQHKEILRGISVWTIDELTGDRKEAIPDTTWYMRMNHIYAEGIYGEFNTLGNNGTARLNRVFTDRNEYDDFIFVQPYDQIITRPQDYHFTNTYSPITNLDFNTCGTRISGEDHLKVNFAVNAGKRWGFGMKFDYLYAIGYYSYQNTSHFAYSAHASYLGDNYQAHLLINLNHQKASENGGITNDEFITHPEAFSDNFVESEIPTKLSSNWNRNDNQFIFFNHRYSLGFTRRVPMTEKEIEAKKFAMASAQEYAKLEAEEDADNEEDNRSTRRKQRITEQEEPTGRPSDAKIAGDEPSLKDVGDGENDRIIVSDQQTADSLIAIENKKKEDNKWMKTEYVPVTTFFHSLKYNNYRRIYQAYETPDNYYLNDYYNLTTDSIKDRTKHFHIHNSFGIALLEGFNKYAQFGLKAFACHELKHFTLPSALDFHNNDNWTEQNLSLGGEISREQGHMLHFKARGEFYVLGTDIGQVDLNGGLDFNFPLFGDTVQLSAQARYSLMSPSFYISRFQSRHLMWDLDMKKENRTHLEGMLSIPQSNTRLRVAIDNISNYSYLTTSYDVDADHNQHNTTVAPKQHNKNLSILTAQVMQDFRFGPLHWDNVITYQKASDKSVIPLPDINIYTGLYLRFKVAKVLDCDLGADARFFTKYYAPEYSPIFGNYAVQENENVKTKIGGYPFVNVFANFQLKYCRFFVMMSHVNYTSGGNYFTTPHYPMNTRILHFGVNWNFNN